MLRRSYRTWLFVLITFPSGLHASSQKASNTVVSTGAIRQFGAWFALGLHSSVPTRSGESFRDFYLFGLRYRRQVDIDRGVAADYMVDLLPLAISTRMPDYPNESRQCIGGCATSAYQPSWHTVTGFGVVPMGLQIRLARSRRVQPFLNASGGALWFGRRIPDPEATRFNFMAQFGGGVQIRTSPSYWLTLGYQYHHTSNGGTGNVNPGLNSWMVMIGLARDR